MESEKSHPLLTFFKVHTVRAVPGSCYDAPPPPQSICPLCHYPQRHHSYGKAKISIVGKGGYSTDYWPDFLTAGHGFFLSERVIAGIVESGLNGFVAHPVTIGSITTDKPMKHAPPQYFDLEATGRVDVDQECLDDHGGSICPVCLLRAPEVGVRHFHFPKLTMPKLETWDGTDFVMFRNWRQGVGNGTIYCTRRFIDLVAANRWTNSAFGTLNGNCGIYVFNCEKDKPADLEWFQSTERKIKEKFPSHFGISDEEAAILFPKAPPGSTFDERLLMPRFDLIEEKFKCKVPAELRALYEDRSRLLRKNFVVDIPLPERIDVRRIDVGFFMPIEENAADFSRSFNLQKPFIEFASDGGEGCYIVNPTHPDPEVILFVMDAGDLYPLEVKLSEFLSARWRPQ